VGSWEHSGLVWTLGQSCRFQPTLEDLDTTAWSVQDAAFAEEDTLSVDILLGKEGYSEILDEVECLALGPHSEDEADKNLDLDQTEEGEVVLVVDKPEWSSFQALVPWFLIEKLLLKRHKSLAFPPVETEIVSAR
jgi:hypothetical protein